MIGIEVEDRRQHQGTRRAVDRGVVHLGELSDQAALVDALDHVQLPQRPGPVERAGDDAADRLGQLLRGAGRWHGVMADVEVDVEVGILDPVRQIETEGNLDQTPAERSELIDPFEDGLLGRLEPGTARRAGGVVDVERRDVAEDARRLHVQEAGIDTAQLAHERTVIRFAV